jgi:hypothetical protein
MIASDDRLIKAISRLAIMAQNLAKDLLHLTVHHAIPKGTANAKENTTKMI